MTTERDLELNGAGSERSRTSDGQAEREREMGNGRRIRVLIVDDHDLFREGLRQLIETDPAIEVVGEAANGQDALKMVAELQPDVVLMDINMPGWMESVRRRRSSNNTGMFMSSC